MARLRRSRFIPSAAYTEHAQLRFGRQVSDSDDNVGDNDRDGEHVGDNLLQRR